MVNNPNAAIDRHTFPPAPQLSGNPVDNLHEAILKMEFNAVKCNIGDNKSPGISTVPNVDNANKDSEKNYCKDSVQCASVQDKVQKLSCNIGVDNLAHSPELNADIECSVEFNKVPVCDMDNKPPPPSPATMSSNDISVPSKADDKSKCVGDDDEEKMAGDDAQNAVEGDDVKDDSSENNELAGNGVDDGQVEVNDDQAGVVSVQDTGEENIINLEPLEDFSVDEDYCYPSDSSETLAEVENRLSRKLMESSEEDERPEVKIEFNDAPPDNTFTVSPDNVHDHMDNISIMYDVNPEKCLQLTDRPVMSTAGNAITTEDILSMPFPEASDNSQQLFRQSLISLMDTHIENYMASNEEVFVVEETKKVLKKRQPRKRRSKTDTTLATVEKCSRIMTRNATKRMLQIEQVQENKENEDQLTPLQNVTYSFSANCVCH